MEGIQLENGYTKIANELLEKLSQTKISGTSWRVLVAILRKLYGFNKKEDWIAYSQIQKITKLPKSRICESMNQLRKYGIVVTEKRNGLISRLHINKNYTITERRTGTEKRNQTVTELRTTKETITKDITANAEKPMYKLQPDEPDKIIDLDTLEESSESKKEARKVIIAQKGYDPAHTNELLRWAQEKNGHRFMKPLKQKKHIADMLAAGRTKEEIVAKWEELEEDNFWANKGIDFSIVASQIDKTKAEKKSNPLLYAKR